MQRRGQSKAHARDLLQALLRDIDATDGQAPRNERKTFAELCDYFERHYVKAAEYVDGRKVAGVSKADYMQKAYDEVIDFIALNNPVGVIAFRPSAVAKERVADLISREKRGKLSVEEKSELDHCIIVEHLMRLAKARACQHLSA